MLSLSKACRYKKTQTQTEKQTQTKTQTETPEEETDVLFWRKAHSFALVAGEAINVLSSRPSQALAPFALEGIPTGGVEALAGGAR